MEENMLINLTLDTLKKRLDEKNTVFIQQENGYGFRGKFSFNDPTTQDSIESFCKKTGWILPPDYKKFLLMHNGAKLFDDEYGGGLEILGLENIIKNHYSYMPMKWYPVAFYIGDFLLIDSERCKAGRKDYLLWFESGGDIENDTMRLELNFELWFDRLISSQGSKFWLWPIYTSTNYYNTH